MKRILMTAALAMSLPLMGGASPALAAPSTEDFVQQVAISDLYEIEAGQMATNKAHDNQVQAFGQRMVDDHSKTSKQLSQLVQDNTIEAQPPAKLDEAHQAKLDELKTLSGAEFDRAYMPQQVTAHEDAVALFKDYAEDGDNAQLKDWAGKTLPALEEHLRMARSLDERVQSNVGAMAGDARATDPDQKRAAPQGSAGAFEYVARQKATDWTAQALIGRNVKNLANETLGEINNVILNEKGDVIAITIGVGGFLGIGEKDVGVPFGALDFRTEAALEAATEDDAEDRREAAQESREQAREARTDTDHDDIEIVLNATRDQLEKAPSYVWLDDQDDDRSVVR